MPDFRRTDHPEFHPTLCVTCHTHACPDGFVDTGILGPTAGFGEDGTHVVPADSMTPVQGRLQVCARCVWAMGRAVGMLDPEQADALATGIEARDAQIAELTDALEASDANRVISLEDARALFAPQQTERKKPGPKPKQTDTTEPEAA